MSKTTDTMADLLDQALVKELEGIVKDKDAHLPAALITAVLKRLEVTNLKPPTPGSALDQIRQNCEAAGLKVVKALPPVDPEADDPATA